MANIRIVSEDGLGVCTKVLNAETGEDITALMVITDVRWSVSVARLASADLQLEMVELDAQLPSDRVQWLTRNPATGCLDPVSSITFRDGTVVHLDDGIPRVEPGDDLPPYEPTAVHTWEGLGWAALLVVVALAVIGVTA